MHLAAGLCARLVPQVQNDRRLARVGRRIDPGVEPVARRQGTLSAPIEGGEHAGVFLRPRHEGGRDHGQQREGAQGVAVPLHQTGGGQAQGQGLRGALHAGAVKRPERPCGGILIGVGELILHGGRRAMGQAGVPVNPRQLLRAGGGAEPRQRGEGRQRQNREEGDAKHAAPARGLQPQAEEGGGKKKPKESQQHGRDGPDLLPGDRKPGAGRESIKPLHSGFSGALAFAHGYSSALVRR